jgi:hypothetical protein
MKTTFTATKLLSALKGGALFALRSFRIHFLHVDQSWTHHG